MPRDEHVVGQLGLREDRMHAPLKALTASAGTGFRVQDHQELLRLVRTGCLNRMEASDEFCEQFITQELIVCLRITCMLYVLD